MLKAHGIKIPMGHGMARPRLLHGLGKLGPNDAVLLGDGTEALSHAALHALQATHVNVGLVVLPGCFFLGLGSLWAFLGSYNDP